MAEAVEPGGPGVRGVEVGGEAELAEEEGVVGTPQALGPPREATREGVALAQWVKEVVSTSCMAHKFVSIIHKVLRGVSPISRPW